MRIDISLVIPAWNEQELLPRLLETVGVARAEYFGGPDCIEVIVADNGSTDQTAEIALAAGCRVAKVEQRCIAAARNGGAAIAQGKILAFADADFRLAPTTFNYINQIMQHPEVIGGGTGLTMDRWSPGICMTWYLIMPPLWLLGLDGGVWFCRREDFQAIGGFNDHVRAGEDVLWLRSLQKLGRSRRPIQRTVTHFSAKRFGLKPALVLNSTRKFDKHGDWHLLRDLILNLQAALFSRSHVDEYIDRYWYRDREAR